MGNITIEQVNMLIAFLESMQTYWEESKNLSDIKLKESIDASLTDQLLDVINTYKLPSLDLSELISELYTVKDELITGEKRD